MRDGGALEITQTLTQKNEFNFYSHFTNKNNSPVPGHLRAIVITSIRDVGKEDMNGNHFRVGDDEFYMTGLLEGILRDSRYDISQVFDVAGVITDDTERDEIKGNLGEYSRRPMNSARWIHPLDMRNYRGELLANFTENIPSNFRSLPIQMTDERIRGKEDFENQVLSFAQNNGADIIISDHLMMRAELLIRAFRNRLLNIHPAITNRDNPLNLRGKSPTQDALDRSNGFRRNHVTGEISTIEPYRKTGATLHFMNEEIDDGPPICDAELTVVHPHDVPQMLRYRNYQNSKIPVFARGIEHYYSNIYPNID